ncbi:tryptophan synthase subunit alpha [Anopheles sinensis]|uniref:Tryptophan synthase subunit alpha n=1 Tax=Anopheles sinensis TaxID=74873 RepID=A0A084VKP2_ANOSI|nr:tryptophan synthase subunit alpha [Anopheles sinensis]
MFSGQFRLSTSGPTGAPELDANCFITSLSHGRANLYPVQSGAPSLHATIAPIMHLFQRASVGTQRQQQ